MFLVLAFVAAWMLQHTWAGKVSDFQTNRDQVRQQIDKAHPNWDAERREKAVHRATRRSAAGWLAYQFRHGWSPMVGDVVDGYRGARIGHAEWLAQRPAEAEGGWWQKAKASAKGGWEQAKAKGRQTLNPNPVLDPTPDPPATAAPAPERADTQAPPAVATVVDRHPGDGTLRIIHTQPTHKPERTEPMSEEVSGYAGAQQLTSGYQDSLSKAGDQLEQYEADLIAGGLGDDASTLASLAAAREALNTAQAAFDSHKGSLNTHEQGAEYAKDKGAAAANTGWLAGGA